MGVEHHDEVLAATSHLPHVLAYGLVDTLAQMEERREIFSYAAGGFRDFTRIASSDPVMWRDICLSNRDALLDVLDKFTSELAELRELIAESDGSGLEKRFAFARDSREAAAGKLPGVFKHTDTTK
jgi:prephenate dehydrogenase